MLLVGFVVGALYTNFTFHDLQQSKPVSLKKRYAKG